NNSAFHLDDAFFFRHNLFFGCLSS
ncbi:MAG: hypothetical protein JWQ70_294, partial [Aeromicrobium sp.]|nr:hypothetical protein [Aeromicrobium sp.]